MIYNNYRKKTNKIKIGDVCIGADFPIAIQSMLNTDSFDAASCIKQAKELEDAGCDIIRLAIPDIKCVNTIYKMKEAGIKTPLVADIHFDYRIALEAAEAGIDKVRINPGNIGAESNIKTVADACNKRNIPIRIGVNSGSVEKEFLKKYGSPTPEALAESALYNASLLEKYDFTDIVISIKSSSAQIMTAANKIVSDKCSYPLHIGVTEAGSGESALIKSSAGIGSLLLCGIGDTVRVSLTGNPVTEVYASKQILSAVGLYEKGYIDVISCPTCGRTKINLIPICEKLKEEIKKLDRPVGKITVAVMGCVVNGPGEASEADIGIAGGDGCAVLFQHGKTIGKISEEEIIPQLILRIESLIKEGK